MYQFVKHLLPNRLRKPLRIYVRRLNHWKLLMRHTRGKTFSDSLGLWLSFIVAPFTAARSLSEWRDPLLLSDVAVNVHGVGVFDLRARSDDLWHVSCFRERSIFTYISNNLHPGDVFVDAGANIGFYSALAARRIGFAGHVISIEMMPDTAAILRNNVVQNDLKTVKVIEKAISEREGGKVSAYVRQGSFGQASLIEGEGREVLVDSTTLDHILVDVDFISLMKLDLEGGELQALRGAEQSLKKTKAVIFESVHEDGEVSDFLAARGFEISNIDGQNRLALRS